MINWFNSLKNFNQSCAYKKFAVYGVGVIFSCFFITSSCSKVDVEESASRYSQFDINAVEASLLFMNNLAMGIETHGTVDPIIQSTCHLGANPPATGYRKCEDDGTHSTATYLWDGSDGATACSFSNGSANGPISVEGAWIENFMGTTTCSSVGAPPQLFDRKVKDDLPVRYTMADGSTVSYRVPKDENSPLPDPDPPGRIDIFGATMFSDGARVSKDVAGFDALIDTVRITRKDSAGANIYDFYVRSDDQLVAGDRFYMTGALSTSDRTVPQNEKLFLYSLHPDLIEITVEEAVVWSSAACCFPRQGKMKYNFREGQLKSQELQVNFNTHTCGVVEVLDAKNIKRNITFNECF